MTGVELSEAERAALDALLPETGFEGLFDDMQNLIAQIVAARLAPVEADVARLTAEVKHWKDHAEEAGRGFAQVAQDAARISARNVELAALVEAGLGLADKWDAEVDEARAHGTPNPKSSKRAHARKLRAALDGAK